MTSTLLVSYAVLWIVVIGLSILLIALARLVGRLHLRVGPAGAMVVEQGPKIGTNLSDLLRRSKITSSEGRDIVLVLVSDSCPACVELQPALQAFARRNRAHIDVIVLDIKPSRRRAERVGQLATIESSDLVDELGIRMTPFVVWCKADGALVAKGIVNTPEHLESLQHARQTGYASIEDYITSARGPGNGSVIDDFKEVVA